MLRTAYVRRDEIRWRWRSRRCPEVALLDPQPRQEHTALGSPSQRLPAHARNIITISGKKLPVIDVQNHRIGT
jgi:hypothetical protein